MREYVVTFDNNYVLVSGNIVYTHNANNVKRNVNNAYLGIIVNLFHDLPQTDKLLTT
jgi:hypothetical protein